VTCLEEKTRRRLGIKGEGFYTERGERCVGLDICGIKIRAVYSEDCGIENGYNVNVVGNIL